MPCVELQPELREVPVWVQIMPIPLPALCTQGGGVFCSPQSSTAKPKLRLLYECAPLAFVVEAAGGASQDGAGSVLDQRIQSSGDRSVICLGSKAEVAKSVSALRASGP